MLDTVEHLEQQPVIIEKRGCGKFRAFGPCTWNNYNADIEKFLEDTLKSNCEKWFINKEIGKEGTPHLQFCMYFKNARTFESVRKKFKGAHIEIAENWHAVKQYCKKTETAISHTSSEIEKFKPKDPLNGKIMKPWQSEIITLCEEEPDDRSIYWYYDATGGCGKTTLAKHLCLKYPEEVLYAGGKSNDIKYGITSFIYNKKGERIRNLRVVIFDYTRSTESFVSYQAIEEVKNGIFYNNKYESRMVIFNPPHVIIFSNFAPDTTKLSEDRWNIIDLEFEN